MHCPLLQPSWIEQTIDLCDEVLLRAAKAHPTNLILRKLVGNNSATKSPVPIDEAQPPSCSQQLAS
jgi:hypothetical protein